jgi:hypothetical protein
MAEDGKCRESRHRLGPPLTHEGQRHPVPSDAVAVILRPMPPLQAAGAAGASVTTKPIKTIGAM